LTLRGNAVVIADLISFLEEWIPPGSAMSRDNPGLQVGDPREELRGVLVALDVTPAVVEEAVSAGVNLILSHHPLIFTPLSRLDQTTPLGGMIAKLVRHHVAVYSAHTNLDASGQGVSMALARALEVDKPRFLAPPESRWLKKLAVFVPPDHAAAVREAMARAGAGVIGEYTHCSFNLEGTGTFQGGENASPAVGVKGNLEQVLEVRIEMILPAWKAGAVVRAMQAAHPYEEVAFDLYPLENSDVSYGFGAIGDLPMPVSLEDLVQRVKERLGCPAVGVMEGPSRNIARLAVCGGSGGELVEAAWKQGADAYLTGEMKYHTLLDYKDRITVLLAGHYPSEAVIVPEWAQRLRQWLDGRPVPVIETRVMTNPLTYQI